MDKRKFALELLLISFLALFFEILYIRWLSDELRIFAYFKNTLLIACFFGMGLGVFLENKRNVFGLFIPILALTVFLVYASPEKLRLVIIPAGESISFWGFWTSQSSLWEARKFFIIIIGFLVLTVGAFIPLGQKIGEFLKRHAPLEAYSINIAGSLAGILAFSVLSRFGAPPFAWFVIALPLTLLLYRGKAWGWALTVLLAIFIPVFILARAEKAFWSPYQKITVNNFMAKSVDGREKQGGYVLWVNNDFHMTGLDLRDEAVRGFPELEEEKLRYEGALKTVKPKDVLIVGSGMGNDVAAAIRMGATDIDAVDIDPMIISIGTRLHPEHPYSSPLVKVHINDARSYFSSCKKKYDLIIFSVLDSHVVFSSYTSLRLDNFVYTVESMKQARKLLKDDGAISLSFIMLRPWMGARFYNMLKQVFGYPPAPINKYTFLISNNPASPFNHSAMKPPAFPEVSVTTDDWPYLYTRDKAIPKIYWYVLGMLFIVTLAFVAAFAPGSIRRIELHFFFLGAAFMLIEVRAISQMALLFGSTWIVNSIVISAVLVMILVATLIVHARPRIPLVIPYACLAASIMAVYFFPMEFFLSAGFATRALFASLMLTLPLFFAGIIFAVSFKNTKDVTTSFASNLLGAIIGGLFEYSSFVFGLRPLCLFSLLFYALSFLPILINNRAMLFGARK